MARRIIERIRQKIRSGQYDLTAHAIEEKGVKRRDTIRIRAKRYSIKNKDNTGLRKGEYVHILFEDSGTGMSDEVKRQAFDPLFTTKEKGIQKGQGLGLAMVYNIVTRNNEGHISIESRKGKGTTFHIILPKAEPVEKAEPKKVLKPAGGNETVLVIDDEEIIRELAANVLEDCGYNVLTAGDGRQGLDRYTTNKDSIDVILLDLAMPEMSGEMVFEEMLKINPDIKVIISSGYSEEDALKGILSRAKAYISKPYKAKQLIDAVRAVLDM